MWLFFSSIDHRPLIFKAIYDSHVFLLDTSVFSGVICIGKFSLYFGYRVIQAPHPSISPYQDIMTILPTTMRALVAPKYCKPDGYVVMDDIPVPSITAPDEILVKVHAAGLVGGDMQVAAGNFKVIIGKSEYVSLYLPIVSVYSTRVDIQNL
jgi:hypothetical protein